MKLTPEVAFVRAPVALTLEGQYIIKNVVLVSAALVAWAFRFLPFFSGSPTSLVLNTFCYWLFCNFNISNPVPAKPSSRAILQSTAAQFAIWVSFS